MPLPWKIDTLLCQRCGLDYPVKNGIPDFVVEDLSKSPHPVLRLVSRIDRLAKIYETPLWYPLVYHFYGGLFIPSVKEEVKMITEMVDAQNRIGLDVACGTGLFTRSVAKKMKLVYGIDVSRGMLDKAAKYAEKEKISNIRLARARAEKLPFRDSLFDGVVCCGALHLFPDTRQALGEMARVMKEGARLAVMTFVKRRFFKFKRVYEHKHLKSRHGLTVFDVEELDDYLSQTGFRHFQHSIYGSMVLFHAERDSL
jgi:ubiquinone/menaquinone biosynthesis C-methylase UbiE